MAAKRKGKPRVQYTEERAACILAEAETYGDVAAAEKWGISTKTLGRYRARAKSDTGLSKVVQHKKALIEPTWRACAEHTMRFLLKRIEQKAASDDESLRDIAGAMHIVASHAVASDALAVTNDRRPEPASESPAPADTPEQAPEQQPDEQFCH